MAAQVTRPTRVFLDASVWLAAVGSHRGGSAAAIDRLLDSSRYETFVSPEVEREARGNVRRKFPRLAQIRLEMLLGELIPNRVDPNAAPDLQDLPASVAAKDYHVVAACVVAGASICLSLDRRHLLTEELRQWGIRRGLRFLAPGEFLAWDRQEYGRS